MPRIRINAEFRQILTLTGQIQTLPLPKKPAINRARKPNSPEGFHLKQQSIFPGVLT